MSRFLLDSDTCIYAINGRPSGVRLQLLRHEAADIAVSAIVAAELRFGAVHSARPEQNLAALGTFLASVRVLDWPADAISQYADLREHLQSNGQLIGAMDMLIAAHALAEDATLVTHNSREFQRVPNLILVDWSV